MFHERFIKNKFKPEKPRRGHRDDRWQSDLALPLPMYTTSFYQYAELLIPFLMGQPSIFRLL